jgi:hypothetical protein
MDPNEWPEILNGVRKIYVSEYVDDDLEADFNEKGYEIVDIRTMPTDTTEDKKAIIQGYTIGVIDGTIRADDYRRKTIELLAKTEGLLINKSISGKLSISLEGKTIKELLSFGDNRHTLKRTTKEEIEKAKLISVTPGGEEDGEIGKDST